MASTPCDNKDTEREFIAECIRLYRDLPSLWKIKSKEYYDRNLKKKDYEVLLAKYQERYPKATVIDLKKKFNTIRTNYRKELKKVKCNNKEPTLWYYEEMSFLEDSLHFKPELESQDPIGSDVEGSFVEYENNAEDSENSVEETTTYIHIKEETPPKKEKRAVPTTTSGKKEKRMKLDYEDIGDLKDEHYYWAMSLAADMRKMEDKQQLFVKKAISEIMIEGQMGLLHRDSVKINEAPII